MKIKPKARRAISEDLDAAGFDGNFRFSSRAAAYSRACEALNAHRIQVSTVVDCYDLTLPVLTVDLAAEGSSPFEPKPLKHALHLSFHDHSTGVEAVAYVS